MLMPTVMQLASDLRGKVIHLALDLALLLVAITVIRRRIVIADKASETRIAQQLLGRAIVSQLAQAIARHL